MPRSGGLSLRDEGSEHVDGEEERRGEEFVWIIINVAEDLGVGLEAERALGDEQVHILLRNSELLVTSPPPRSSRLAHAVRGPLATCG
jgi:hypothetical protein